MNAVCNTDPTTLIMALFEPLSSLFLCLEQNNLHHSLLSFCDFSWRWSTEAVRNRIVHLRSVNSRFFFFFFSLLRFFLPAKRIFIPSDARGKQSSFVILPLPLGKRLPANTVNLTSQTRAPRIRRRSRWTKRLINR